MSCPSATFSCMLMGGTLMARFGWRPFFMVLGLVSLLWLIPWIKWMPKEARLQSPQHDRSSQSVRVPAIAIGMGNMYWVVLRQLRELRPDHVVALLPGTWAALLNGQDGQNRRKRLFVGCWLRYVVRLAFRPLDQGGTKYEPEHDAGISGSVNMGHAINGALFDPDHYPSSTSENLRNPAVAMLVALDLVPPELDVTAGQTLAVAPMPEAAIDEHCPPETRSSKIGLSSHWPVLAITS
jgi:hypothetical protein